MLNNEKINEFIATIKRNYKETKSFLIGNPTSLAGSIRATLEFAVKLFWLKKYDKEPVWVVNDKEAFNLHNAIKDEKFSKCFNDFLISDMHAIRQTCNDILHNGKELTMDTAKELSERLEKCIQAIEETLELRIITSKNHTKELSNGFQPQDTTTNKSVPKYRTSAKEEREYFWRLFDEIIAENGNPFVCRHREHYATINQPTANSGLCLSLDFLVQKEFVRVGIYIQDDRSTRCFYRLHAQKEDIEKKLGFAPIWNENNITQGQRNPYTRRIEKQIRFRPYDRDGYRSLINKVMSIIMKFIETFSVYLPEAFPNISTQGEKVMNISAKAIENNIQEKSTKNKFGALGGFTKN